MQQQRLTLSLVYKTGRRTAPHTYTHTHSRRTLQPLMLGMEIKDLAALGSLPNTDLGEKVHMQVNYQSCARRPAGQIV